jgi:protein-S-isoprenylcysteine O-methyltransferase Ste14
MGRTRASGRDRAPVVANFTAVVLFFASLIVTIGRFQLALALSGCLLAFAGAGLVRRSRVELGAAWSLLPEADPNTGLVTTGPYRFVRHPIYLGFILLALGAALAFSSWPALCIVLAGVVPTFAWRAHAEEALLSSTFGERFTTYRRRTKMIIPYLL